MCKAPVIIANNKPKPSFLQAECPSCRPINSVKAQKGKLQLKSKQTIKQNISCINLMQCKLNSEVFHGKLNDNNPEAI